MIRADKLDPLTTNTSTVVSNAETCLSNYRAQNVGEQTQQKHNIGVVHVFCHVLIKNTSNYQDEKKINRREVATFAYLVKMFLNFPNTRVMSETESTGMFMHEERTHNSTCI